MKVTFLSSKVQKAVFLEIYPSNFYNFFVRLDAIARDAELLACDSKSENNLKRLAQELHNRLNSNACNDTEVCHFQIKQTFSLL